MKKSNYIKKVELPKNLVEKPVSQGWSPNSWKNEFEKILKSPKNEKRENTKKLSKNIIRYFSSNFYTVSRILPKQKRSDVECIYATVRFPDEIVDTFNISIEEKIKLIENWEKDYEKSLKTNSFDESLNITGNPIISSFRELCITHSIPEDYYPNFLQSMKEDLKPKIYYDFEDLIENYIFGSAITVGYLLTYAYGHSMNSNITSALKTSRDLGIALQLTIFARDIKDDFNRNRCYAPKTIMDNLYKNNHISISNEKQMKEVQKVIAEEAEKYYLETWKGINNFSIESVPAISACTSVFQKLNQKIIADENSVSQRCSLSMYKKITSIPIKHATKISCLYLIDSFKR